MSELVASPAVSIESYPDDPSGLWGLSRLFMLSWTEGFEVSTTWFTNTATANNGSQKRWSISGKPDRILRFTLKSLNRRQSWLLMNMVKRMGMYRSLVPIYSDFTTITQQVYFGWHPNRTGIGLSDSGTVILNLSVYPTPSWSASSVGVVVVTPNSTPVVYTVDSLPVYSGLTLVTPGHVTYTIPSNCYLVNQTSGDLTQTVDYNVEFICGTHNYTIPHTGGTGIHVYDVASALSLPVVNWTALNLSVFTAMGVASVSNTVTFRLELLSVGVSYATVLLPTPVTFPCDTTNRRFFVGQAVAIYSPSQTPEISTFETGYVADMSATYLALSGGVTNVYPSGSRVVPLIECDLMAESTIPVVTDSMVSVSIIAKETEGPSSLPPLLEITAASPYTIQNSYPVFYTVLHWTRGISEGYHATINTTKSGIGDLYEVLGARPRFKSARSTYTITRTAAWKILSFFDFVCGSTFPFFVLSVVAPFDLIGLTASAISVKSAGPLADWNELAYIAVVQRSTNLPYVVPIASVSRSLGIDTITLGAELPTIPLSDVRSVNPTFLVRFGSDEIVEKWITDCQVMLTFSLIEVLQEGSITLTGF